MTVPNCLLTFVCLDFEVVFECHSGKDSTVVHNRSLTCGEIFSSRGAFSQIPTALAACLPDSVLNEDKIGGHYAHQCNKPEKPHFGI